MDSGDIGRRAQKDALRALLDTSHAGAAGSLVVGGAAGLGKSLLLDEIETMATNFAVIRTRAVQFESRMPFAALQHLLAPRLPLLPTLPPQLRGALEMAFGSRPGRPDPFTTGLGVIALLTAVPPTLCLIDDAQYLDQFSAEALVLAARRLTHEPVAVIFATRPEHHVEALGELPQLRLAPLSHMGARRLLSSTLPAPLDDRVRDQILSESRGVPAAITEVARCVRLSAHLAGGYALPGVIEPPRPLTDEYEHRLADLPAAARRFVLLAAADPTGDPALLWKAAEAAGIDRSTAAIAVDAVGMDIGARVSFAHPLVRSAIYHCADASERREIHRLLGAAADEATSADRRAWHQGQAAIAPDEEASRNLESGAGAALSRGGVAAAAAFLERGAALTADPRRRLQLALQAGAVKLDAGDINAALDLSASARLDAMDEIHLARVDAFEAQVAFARTRRPEEARRLVDAAGQLERREPRTGAPARLQAMIATYLTGSEGDTSALDHPTVESDETDLAELVAPALASAMSGELARALPLARRAVDALLRHADEPQGFDPAWAWIVCSIAWDDQALNRILDEQLKAVRQAGRVGAYPVALTSRALVHMHSGEFARATDCIAEAKQLSDTVPELVELGVAGWRGDHRSVEEMSGRLVNSAPGGLGPRQLAGSTYARLLIHNGTGNYRRALAAAEAYSGHDELGFHVFIPPELVEAAARDGRIDLARDLTERLGERATAAGTPWALGIYARCQALVSTEAATEELFSASIDQLRDSQTPIQLARSQLLFGEWLRRRQQRNEARTHLRAAVAAFSLAGAALFAKRAARELRAAGEVAPQPRGPGGLSAQELAVAVRVADGKTSKEVAAELVLSPRTVDAHLRSIFSKLGVTSRRQIRHALPPLSALHEPRPVSTSRHATRS